MFDSCVLRFQTYAHTRLIEQFLNDWMCARPAAAGSPAFHELPADLQRYVTLLAETNDSTMEEVLKGGAYASIDTCGAHLKPSIDQSTSCKH